MQLIVSMTDCLFHMQRRKERRGLLGSRGSAAKWHSLRARGRQSWESSGLCGRARQSTEPREPLKPPALQLPPSPQQGSWSHRVRKDFEVSMPPFLFTDEATKALEGNLPT